MAYGEKYILSFISERGNDYKISILQQGYSGSAVNKKLGVAPSLSIEEGDGRIKGSSLSFSIQADVEGELSGLYTTNNKEFKVILYRNNSVYWQGYLLPELYSENYVDPPFDVAVTATDQLATLKDIPYQAQEQQMSLLSIIKNILNYTEITLPCTVHMQIEDSQGLSLLENHYISAAAMNGYNCYDALNALLLSCNACIMQIGNEWLITSLTDNTATYYKDGQLTNRPHPTIGQMHKADICPNGSLTMVNAPAIKGVTLEYNHILRSSMLNNAECNTTEYWDYLPGQMARLPGDFLGIDNSVYKLHSWGLLPKNIAEDASLQLWQDVQVRADESFNYELKIKYLADVEAKLLLLSLVHYGNDGIARRLTVDGWKKSFDKNDVNSYIQITSSNSAIRYIWDLADKSKYEVATVQFALPAFAGTLRVGFINSTVDYKEPVLLNVMWVTDVFLTPSNITGKTATTVVEQSATISQEQVVLSYGDRTQTENDSLISFNTIKSAQDGYISTWNLSGRSYASYFLMMLQEFSRYFGKKRMQLQGAVIGDDLLYPFYADMFSGKILRLLSAQYDLFQDTMGITIEEVPISFVDYETTVYAKENQSTHQSSVGGIIGADSLFERINVGTPEEPIWAVVPKDVDGKGVGIITKSFIIFGDEKEDEGEEGVGSTGITTFDVYVGNDGPYSLINGRVNLPAYPTANLTGYATENWVKEQGYVSSDVVNGLIAAFNAYKLETEARLAKIETMWFWDQTNSAVRTPLNIVIDGAVTFGDKAIEVNKYIPFNVLDESTGEYVQFNVLDENTGEHIPLYVKNEKYEILNR